jgi:hypothetical protein
MKRRTFKRDAAVVELMNGYLVNTCDSAGGIGELETDVLKVDIQTVALATLKVALLENMTLGTNILSVNATFMNSPKYVQPAIDALNDFLKKWKIPIVLSTEKNFSTVQTGVGIGVVGFSKGLRVGGAKPGYGVYVIGIPEVGKEVIKDEKEAASFEDILELMESKSVGEIIPVGSSGIMKEAKLLAQNSNLNFVSKPDMDEEWMHKSAGPVTCAVFWAKDVVEKNKKIRKIGWLK